MIKIIELLCFFLSFISNLAKLEFKKVYYEKVNFIFGNRVNVCFL